MIDYSQVDNPLFLKKIFIPRKDVTPPPRGAFDLFVAVWEGISVACRFYMGHHQWPWILFFHGNGEVVSDYDEIFSLYHEKNLNIVVADYRGYGASSGIPTLTDVLQDAHIIFKEISMELSRRRLRVDLWVMGRSLGSLSALELAYHYPEALRGLIIESGFPSVGRIMSHLGIPAHGMNLDKMDQECLDRIERILLPTLVIHGQQDELVPVRNAIDLYEHLGSKEKELLIISGATHNDIMFVGLRRYFDALHRFIQTRERVRISPGE